MNYVNLSHKVYLPLHLTHRIMNIESPEKFTRRKVLVQTVAIGVLGISGCATKSDSTTVPSLETSHGINANIPTSKSPSTAHPKKRSTPEKVCSPAPVTPIPRIQKFTPILSRELPFTDGIGTISTHTLELDQAILDLINKRRWAYGNDSLKLDKQLSEVGREHGLLMANEKLISKPNTSHFKSTTVAIPLHLPLGKHPRTYKITSLNAESASEAALDDLMYLEEVQNYLLDPSMKYGAVGSVYSESSYWITIYLVQLNSC